MPTDRAARLEALAVQAEAAADGLLEQLEQAAADDGNGFRRSAAIEALGLLDLADRLRSRAPIETDRARTRAGGNPAPANA